jgi:hypothetical protein
LCGLADSRESAGHFIAGGLIYVNSVVCINPKYDVNPGDVITMNNEAYWTNLTREMGSYVKDYLAEEVSPGQYKREFLKELLGLIKNITTKNVVLALANDQERGSILYNRPWESIPGTNLFEPDSYLGRFLSKKRRLDAYKN